MASLEEAQERFAKAIAGLERALTAARKRQDEQQALVQELAAIKARHAALEAEHKKLRKSYDAICQRQQAIAKRLDGTISGLREVLSS